MIADWTELVMEAVTRAGDPTLTQRAEMLTGLAERDLARLLRVGDMETQATVVTDAQGTAALPADFLEARLVTVDGARLGPAALPLAGTGYAVRGRQVITGLPARSLALSYYAAPPPLGPTRASNWLLAAEPELYLYALLKQAFLALGRAPEAQAAGDYLAFLAGEVSRTDAATRLGGQTITVQGVTP